MSAHNDFFRILPKMTNNHLHLFAMYPYKKLIDIIKQTDPELYDKIYVLKEEKCYEKDKSDAEKTAVRHEIKTALSSHKNIYKNMKKTFVQANKSKKTTSKKEFKDLFKESPDSYAKIAEIIKKRNLMSDKDLTYCYLLNNMSFGIFNPNESGVSFDEITTMDDWIPLRTVEEDPNVDLNDILTIGPDTPKPFYVFENIQKMFRIFVRNYKVYYYLWYASLIANYNNHVFYLNVKGKPGNINKDVKFSHRLYLESNQCLNYYDFTNKMDMLARADSVIQKSDYKYLYKQYRKIKMESDIIIKCLNDFNSTKNMSVPFASEDHLINDSVKINFSSSFDPDKSPQMMVQYTLTFPKTPKDVSLDIRAFSKTMKFTIYACILINDEYGFRFFNGVDLVGNEQETRDFSDFIPSLNDILPFRKQGINVIPHIGETNEIKTDITLGERYVINNAFTRVGHGLSFITTPAITTELQNRNQKLYLEICPISNWLLDYFDIDQNPARKILNNPYLLPVICSDDNGIFGYDTVSKDYELITTKWNLNNDNLYKIIMNGIELIHPKYQRYYMDLFEYLWKINISN